MAYTDARKRANQKWDAEHLERLSVAVPKGAKDQIRRSADQVGESVNQYVQKSILQRMGKDEWDKDTGRESDTDTGRD